MRFSVLARELALAWPALVIALLALVTTPHAPWRVLGALTTALVAGLLVRGIRDLTGAAPPRGAEGLRIFATTVLRIGVVLSALRLDWNAIAAAGARPWLVALVAVVGGLGTLTLLSRILGVRGPLIGLVAIGTSVCGAAAITAAVQRLGPKDEDVTLGIALISVLGAALSVLFVLVHALVGLEPTAYALATGGALHEVAHVVAAAAAAPEVSDLALLTKLARVAMLPVGLALVTLVAATRSRSRGGGRIPGLALAFFAVSLAGSLPGWLFSGAVLEVWNSLRDLLLQGANGAMAASMAAIGLRLAPRELLRTDKRTLAFAVLAAAAMVVLISATVTLTG